MSTVTLTVDPDDTIIVAGLDSDSPAHALLAALPGAALSEDARTWSVPPTAESSSLADAVDRVRALLADAGHLIAEPSHEPATQSARTVDRSGFLWSISDVLRGDYKRSEYLEVVLPLTMIRRLDFLLAATKPAVLAVFAAHGERPEALAAASGIAGLYNTSPLDSLSDVAAAPDPAAALRGYLAGFCAPVRELVGAFGFDTHITRLDNAGLMRPLLGMFTDARLDLHPDRCSSIDMGFLYEELLRRFCEISHDTAGEHYTPAEVVALMADLLLCDPPTAVDRIEVLDPAAGTGGMLAETHHRLRRHYPAGTELVLCGQELNPQTYAVAAAEHLMSGRSGTIALGNSLTADAFTGRRFDLLIANPPFGVDWRRVADPIRAEHARDGFGGRFGAGLPRTGDGTLLFLQHMIAKMRPAAEGGSRIAILTSASALFNGDPGSGESEIRRWIIDNDWLEAIVALPDAMFYNTTIAAYLWILSNRKPEDRQGRIAYVDARDRGTAVGRRLGSKKHELSPEQVAAIVADYRACADSATVKILPNHAFGQLQVKLARPLRARWEISDATRAAAVEHPTLRGLAADTLAVLRARLAAAPDEVLLDQEKARIRVTELLAGTGLKRRAIHQGLLTALRVPDPDAAAVLDALGRPIPDPGWSRTVQIPLTLNLGYEPDPSTLIDSDYCRRLIEQHLDDADPGEPGVWAEPARTRLGYRIDVVNHHFRPEPTEIDYGSPAEIIAEIIALTEESLVSLRELQAMLGDVVPVCAAGI